MTTIERIQESIAAARDEQKTNCPPAAGREFALAITALEDAGMRFNRGYAIKAGLTYDLLGRDSEAVVEAEEAKILLAAAEGHGQQLNVEEVIALAEADQLAESA